MDTNVRKTKPNKLRAKEHRERKKEFIDKLHAKVKTLETQVIQLKIENKQLNDILKSAISPKTQDVLEEKKSSLEKAENYAYVELPKSLKENPKQVRFTMLDQAFEQT